MSFEAGPGPDSQREFASLQGCFVEGNAEQRARERGIHRRALIISVAAQSVIVTLIILIPLFVKPEHIALANMVPIPPYYHENAPAHPEQPPRQNTQRRRFITQEIFSQPTSIPTHIDEHPDPLPAEPPGTPVGAGPETACPGCIPIVDGRPQPEPPREAKPQKPQRIFKGHIEPAMLIYRVEPSYPALARQVRIEGHVELHAIIATDGTIQSLQVISGHPLLVQSALEAVRQWRYRATILDGQPVEVDTYITVVYTLQR
jgi:protein TonB